MSIRTCPLCKRIIFGVCKRCNIEPSVVEVSLKGNDVENQKTDEVTQQWIGPLSEACKKCGAKKIYVKFLTPPSPDEPMKSVFNCFSCANQHTEYKH